MRAALVAAACALSSSGAGIASGFVAHPVGASRRPAALAWTRVARVPRRMAAEDADDAYEEDDSPNAEPVQWLAPLDENVFAAAPTKAEGRSTMPIFPLGAVAYTPGSEHVLNIFEPRYRQMYNDIIENGARRFVVTMVNQEHESQYAEVGVVFYMNDLSEVSQQTGDQIKYVCRHSVIGRVRIHGVLNQRSAFTRDTYMRAEVSDIADDDDDADTRAEEEELVKQLALISELGESTEDVRIAPSAIATLTAKRGTEPGSLWAIIELWKGYLEARAMAVRNRLSNDVQKRVVKYLTDDGEKSVDEIPQQVNVDELPASLQAEIKGLTDMLQQEIAPMLSEQTTSVQRMLQATSHRHRLALVADVVEQERRRIAARRALKSLFGDSR